MLAHVLSEETLLRVDDEAEAASRGAHAPCARARQSDGVRCGGSRREPPTVSGRLRPGSGAFWADQQIP